MIETPIGRRAINGGFASPGRVSYGRFLPRKSTAERTRDRVSSSVHTNERGKKTRRKNIESPIGGDRVELLRGDVVRL